MQAVYAKQRGEVRKQKRTREEAISSTDKGAIKPVFNTEFFKTSEALILISYIHYLSHALSPCSALSPVLWYISPIYLSGWENKKGAKETAWFLLTSESFLGSVLLKLFQYYKFETWVFNQKYTSLCNC